MSVRPPVVSLFAVASLMSGAFLAGPAAPQQPRRIEWLIREFPPFLITEGPRRGQGISDVIGHMIQREMGDWTHVTTVAEVVEMMRRMTAGHEVCATTRLKTPTRDRQMHFSVPFLIVPPNGITIRSEDLERFGGGGEVVLSELMPDSTLKLAIADGRSYGAEIDAVLEDYKNTAHVYPRLGSDTYRSLFDMLLKKTVDYIIGFPYEAVFLARELGIEGQVVSLPIAESRDYILSHVACSKSRWGAEAISEINAAIRRLRTGDDYREAIERWLDEGFRLEFRDRYREEFLAAE